MVVPLRNDSCAFSCFACASAWALLTSLLVLCPEIAEPQITTHSVIGCPHGEFLSCSFSALNKEMAKPAVFPAVGLQPISAFCSMVLACFQDMINGLIIG